jgi:Condensation domain
VDDVVDEGAGVALTFGQEQLLAIEKLSGPRALTLPCRIPLAQGVSLPLVAETLTRLVRRHEALRMSALPGGRRQEVAADRPVQFVADDAPLPPQACGAEELARAPLYFSVDRNRDPAVVTVPLHHAFVDGWSAAILNAEFIRHYTARAAGRRTVPVPPVTMGFAGYAADLSHRVDGEAVAAHMAFWARELAGVPPVALPRLRHPWRPGPRFGVRPAMFFELTELPVDRLLRAAPVLGGSTATAVLAAFAATLAAATGQRDLLLHAAVSDRGTAQRRAVVGCLINLVALRIRLPGDLSATGIVDVARATLARAARCQLGPFQRHGRYLPQGRVLDVSPLLTLAFNQELNVRADPALGVRSHPADPRRRGGVQVWKSRGASTSDLHLEVQPGARQAPLRFRILYREDLWDESAIESIGLDVAAWLRRLAR